LSDKPNEGLEEIARILNLHAASGILPKKPKGCRDSPLWRLFINFEQYRISKKFNSNPNASLIDQMQKVGVQFILCGQTMVFRAVTQLNCIITYSLRKQQSGNN
jgi:hypothetical protein